MKRTRDYFKQENSLKHNASMHEAYSSSLSKQSSSQSESRHLPPGTHRTWVLPSCHPWAQPCYEHSLCKCVWRMAPTSLMLLSALTEARTASKIGQVLQYYSTINGLKNQTTLQTKYRLEIKPVSKRLSYFTFPCVFSFLFWATYT